MIDLNTPTAKRSRTDQGWVHDHPLSGRRTIIRDIDLARGDAFTRADGRTVTFDVAVIRDYSHRRKVRRRIERSQIKARRRQSRGLNPNLPRTVRERLEQERKDTHAV